MSPRSFALGPISLVLVLGCAREPKNDGVKPKAERPVPAKPAAEPRETTPAAELAKLGPVRSESEHHRAPDPAKVELRTSGAIGDELEGDVSRFKVLSTKRCSDPNLPPAGSGGVPNPAAKNVVAVEVEIVAKNKLSVNPRDLSLGKGGIQFSSSVDPKRTLEGCTPLLSLAWLRPKESARGYVLFDLPTWGPGSNLNELNLVYHPARFGGSVPVYVTLAGSKS